MQAVNGLQGVGGVLVDDVLGQSRQVIPGGHPRRLVDNVQRHVPVPAQTLVQQGEGVPQGAVGHPGDEQRRVVVQLGVFPLGHVLQPPGNVLGGDALKVEPLAPG